MKQVYNDTLEFINKYRIVTLLWAAWTVGVVTFVVYQVFIDITKITMPVATALASVFGLPAIAAGIMKWRNQDKP